jgi:hypothetical protein
MAASRRWRRDALYNAREAVHMCYLREQTRESLQRILGFSDGTSVARCIALAQEIGAAIDVIRHPRTRQASYSVRSHAEVLKIDALLDEREAVRLGRIG